MTLTMRRNGIAVTTQEGLPDFIALGRALRTFARLERRRATLAKQQAERLKRKAA